MKYIYLALLLILQLVHANEAELETFAEKSNWLQTGKAEETQRLCHTFKKHFPKKVQCHTYGQTPENRSLYYLTIGDPKTPAVWVQAGIHAGEIDGKDAVFLLIRDILKSKIKVNPLKGIHLVFIPIVNLDGHERRGKWNRPNQVGPEEMGWRTTAQNYNMNRDFMKVDAPEMRDLLKLWHKIDPILSLDLHVTNGAQFEPEVGLIVVPNTHHGESRLHQAGKTFEIELLKKMKERNHLALPFYPSFEIEDDPLSGFSRYVSLGRFAHGYWYNNNRLGMLVETHSWKDYATRVRTHYDTVLSSLEIAQIYSKNWQSAGKELDSEIVSGKVELEFKRTNKSEQIDFPGYSYTKEKSHISGGSVIKYNSSRPQIWKVPFYQELTASLIVDAPVDGYFIPAAESGWLIPKLRIHGIKFAPIKEIKLRQMKVFRATKRVFSPSSFEGRQTLSVEGMWTKEEIKLEAGSFFVPILQSKARLLLQLLEPLAQDSFLSWGFFNRVFEQKEYMEDYVTEEVASQMLKLPDVKDEFEKRLKSDPDFSQSPAERFNFFYRKHPSWDERFNRYPVFKY